MLVPEFILHSTILELLDFLRTDYSTSNSPEESFLSLLCGDVGHSRYNYFEQATQIFIENDKKSPRLLQIDLGFNLSRDKLPAIHIVMPSESESSNALGQDEYTQEVDSKLVTTVSGRYKSTYDIVVFSDNSNETVLIYHIIKSLLKSAIPILHLKGLYNVGISGTDLAPYVDIAPQNIYSRAVRLSLEYESTSPSFYTHINPTGLKFLGTPID
jgi:hypothetical protein